jgi:LPXTG-motif cell wall-anchored protein
MFDPASERKRMNDQYGWIYLAGLIAIVIGSLVFLKRKRKMPDYAKWDARIGCLMILFLISPACMWVGNYIYTSKVSIPNEQRQIRADADKIIRALTRFKQSHNYYPEQLTELVPQYLEAIPTDPQGRSYRYSSKNDDFLLQFTMPLSGLFGEEALWECSSKQQVPECRFIGD